MDQKQLMERWIKQINSGQLNPEALGLGSDKNEAIIKLKNQITQISKNKYKY